MSKIFFDTNIVIYSGDSRDLRKQIIAREITERSIQENNGVISTQVLQEYCSIEIKKFNRDPFLIRQSLKFWQRFEVIAISPILIEEALEIGLIYQFSFWDSLMIAAALAAKCSQLMTEDLNHGQVIQGLKIINPFKE